MLTNTPALRLPPDGLLEENPNDKPPVAPPNPGPLPNAAERQRGAFRRYDYIYTRDNLAVIGQGNGG